MKHKAKAKRTTGRKAASSESIQDFMLKLSAGLGGQAPQKKHAGACRSVGMDACWVVSWESVDGVIVTAGLTDGARGGHEDTMLICVRDRAGCHHVPLPSRAVALVITERMARAMRLADGERRAGAD